MIQIAPVLILPLLPRENQADFQEAVNKQFEAFTHRELGIIEIEGSNKWWGINPIDTDGVNAYNMPDFVGSVPRAISQAYPNQSPVFTQNELTVVVYAHSGNVNIGKMESLLNNIKDKILPYLNPIYYGVFSDKQSEVSEPFIDYLYGDDNPFNAVVLLDESNRNQENPNGYLNLYEGKDSLKEYVYPLAAQILLNLALGYSELNKKAINSKVFAGGAFSFVYEKDVLKSQKGKADITVPILTRFFSSETSPFWKDINIAPQALTTFKHTISAENIYNGAVDVFSDKFEEIEHFYKHAVSPWDLLSQSLLPKYFYGENKLLLKKLAEYGSLMDFRLTSLFSRKLNEKIIESETKLTKQLHGAAFALWSEWREGDKKPIGISQFLFNLDLIRQELTKTKEVFDKNDREFSLVCEKNEPIVPPKQIFEEYNKISTVYAVGTSANDLSEAEAEKGKEGQGILNLLKKKLEFHPVPLSLFVRSFILGLVLAIVSFCAIYIIPDTIINTSWFEHGAGRVVWFVGMYLLPIIIALSKYHWATIKKIRLLKTKYLAWVFRRIQLRLIEKVRLEVSVLLDKLISECDTIEGNLKTMVEPLGVNDIVDLAEKTQKASEKLQDMVKTKESEYPINLFQKHIVDSQYVEDGDIDTTITIGNNIIPTSQLNEDDYYHLFARYFIGGEKVETLFKNIKDKLPIDSFIGELQEAFAKGIAVDIDAVYKFRCKQEAISTLNVYSHPSGHNYVGNKTEFSIPIVGREQDVTDGLSPLLCSTNDGTITTVSVIGTDSHSGINLKGFMQLCKFYRLGDKNACRYTKKRN